MIKKKKVSGYKAWLEKRLLLYEAIFWVFLSIPLVCGPMFYFVHSWKAMQQELRIDRRFQLKRIIQTGPQKAPLSTRLLADIMELSKEQKNIFDIDVHALEEKCLRLPIFREVYIKIHKPDALYIDYTLRMPIAFVADYENIAIDSEGMLFPIKPFLTPKRLPEFYFGLEPFGLPSIDSHFPTGIWHKSLASPALSLAFEVLDLFEGQKKIEVKRIDLSSAFLESPGRREVVVILDERVEGKMYQRMIRFPTKDIAAAFANYLELREGVLSETKQDCTVDLRIPHLGFIQEKIEGK